MLEVSYTLDLYELKLSMQQCTIRLTILFASFLGRRPSIITTLGPRAPTTNNNGGKTSSQPMKIKQNLNQESVSSDVFSDFIKPSSYNPSSL